VAATDANRRYLVVTCPNLVATCPRAGLEFPRAAMALSASSQSPVVTEYCFESSDVTPPLDLLLRLLHALIGVVILHSPRYRGELVGRRHATK
jgi:hypothetical protein